MRAECESAGCTVTCGADEFLLTAYCGAKRDHAIFPTEQSASCHRHGPDMSPLVAACAKVAAAPAGAPAHEPAKQPAIAHDLPKLDVAATCRAEQNKATVDSCMAAEDHARQRLGTEWGQFAAGDRTQCTQVSNMPGFQSYVELLTCLEMVRDARKLPKDITQQ